MGWLNQAMMILTVRIADDTTTIINQKEHNPIPARKGKTYSTIEEALLDMWQPAGYTIVFAPEGERHLYTFSRPAE